SQPVVIVNQEFVRRFIPGGSPLGQRVSVVDYQYMQNMEIVGVVANTIPSSLRERSARPCVFVPFFQLPPGRIGFATFEIQVTGSFSDVSTAVLDLLRPQLPGLSLATRPFTAQIE